jgi:cell filamentation protein
MTFDPFGDFESRGYLRNHYGLKNRTDLAAIEQGVISRVVVEASRKLRLAKNLGYKHVLLLHEDLFKDVYPWAGEDRSVTAPDLDIRKGAYRDMFALPGDCERAFEYAMTLASGPDRLRLNIGTVMGYMAHAHPFLDGNGRTLIIFHQELCRRANFHVDWFSTNKEDYLAALTEELYHPDEGALDKYLGQFVRDGALEPDDMVQIVTTLPGLK